MRGSGVGRSATDGSPRRPQRGSWLCIDFPAWHGMAHKTGLEEPFSPRSSPEPAGKQPDAGEVGRAHHRLLDVRPDHSVPTLSTTSRPSEERYD